MNFFKNRNIKLNRFNILYKGMISIVLQYFFKEGQKLFCPSFMILLAGMILTALWDHFSKFK